jgi:preprotein translocase subunit SecE
MNRALRRQQLKEKERKSARSSAPRAMPTTGPKQTAREAAQRGGFSFPPRFIMDIVNELRKVVWPKREDVVHLTVVIVIVTIIIGAVLGLIDIGFGWLIDELLLN